MNYVALVPLRGGSKSIPNKCIKPICGQPLCFWSINSALKSGVFSEIWVSTDSIEIKKVVSQLFGDAVKILDRPDEFAKDTSSTESVMLHFAENANFDVLCTIQATSPLVTSEDFVAAKSNFEKAAADSLVTACEFKRFLWSWDGEPQNYDPTNRPRRQDFAGNLVENGAFYFTKKELLTNSKCRLGGKISIHEMPSDTFLELDEPGDWTMVESLLRAKSNKEFSSSLSQIKGIVLDVDGTLTDGGMYYGPEGEQLKKFKTTDAKGIELLRSAGIKVAIITGESSPSVHSRMEKMKISEKDYFHGIQDKLPVLNQWAESEGIGLSEIAYGGDDIGDKECLERVGFSFAPSDANESVLGSVNYITQSKGGEGSVREVCDLILGSRKRFLESKTKTPVIKTGAPNSN